MTSLATMIESFHRIGNILCTKVLRLYNEETDSNIVTNCDDIELDSNDLFMD